MITVEEATSIIQSTVRDFGTEEINLTESYGRILREPITADRDFPPFDRVAMDGIAIHFDAFEKGQREFVIEETAAAGAPQHTLDDKEKCLEVMTGAILPEGVDTVIRYEDLSIDNGKATILEDKIRHRQNIHFKGLDRKAGSVIISPGVKISAAEVSTCATVGKARIKVSKLPQAIVISSGDELVDIDQTPAPHQIRSSNLHMIRAALAGFSLQADSAHITDEYETVLSKLKEFLQAYDLIILSGGVSMGKFDYLPKVLDALGVTKRFHKIKQRPGKPFWFGTHDATTVFAFPGNPVSSFMCLNQYLLPWLGACIQQKMPTQPTARLTDDVSFRPDLTYFMEVSLEYSPAGELLATPVKGNGSGDLANLSDADAFVQLPMEKSEFNKGECYPVIIYR